MGLLVGDILRQYIDQQNRPEPDVVVVLMGEHDERVSLLGRLIEHAGNTARYNVFYGTGRDFYDVRGRTAHEALFNPNDGRFRAPSTQQGYSPFSTWTRGLAWAMVGFAWRWRLASSPNCRRR